MVVIVLKIRITKIFIIDTIEVDILSNSLNFSDSFLIYANINILNINSKRWNATNIPKSIVSFILGSYLSVLLNILWLSKL